MGDSRRARAKLLRTMSSGAPVRGTNRWAAWEVPLR